MHEMNRSLVAVVSWCNFKLIWLHRSLVSKTIKRKIKPTLMGKVEKQGTPTVDTLQNIPISNKLNLHYRPLGLRHHLLQKTNDITSVQNIFYFLCTQRPCVWPRYFLGKILRPLYNRTMKKADRILRIVHFTDQRGAALLRNGAQNTVLMYEMKPYPAWFSCQCKSYPVPLQKKIQGIFPTLCSW